MAVQGSLRGGDRIPAASARKIPCGLGTCALGTVGQNYTFDPGQDVAGTLGPGKLTQWVLYIHATTGSRAIATPTTATYPAFTSAVAQSGSGPACTVAAASGFSGACDDFNFKFKVKVAGANGAAQVDVYYDGHTVAERVTIPAEGAAVLRGKVDIRNGADLSGLHLDFTAPSSDVITFSTGSLDAAAAGLKAATATVASIVALTASDLLAAGKAAILAHPRRLTFATAGVTPSDAPANVAIVGTRLGAAVSETLTLAQTATSVTSAKEYDTITSITYPAADGTAATIAIGYNDGFASPAEICTALDALADSASLAVHARPAETSTGEVYLELYSTSGGTGVSQTIDASASTADTPLGFNATAPANLTATGTAATMTLPFTGLTWTWVAGVYVLDEEYTKTLPGPRASVAALSAAATVARNNYSTKPFGLLVQVEDGSTMQNAKTTQTTLTGLVNTWAADPAAPIYVDALTSTAFHTASATLATNDVNIATNDAAFLTEFPATTPDSVLDSIAHDDVYIPGASGLPTATYRRPATWAGASKVASAAKIAANPADGGVLGATLVGPDGTTRARDENRATTKLGGGFSGVWAAWVLKSTSAGLAAPAFEVCATRAGASSRLREPGAVAIGREIQRLCFEQVERWNGQTWEGDALNPIAAAIEETSPRADHLHQILGRVLRPGDFGVKGDQPDAPSPNNVTNFDVTVNAPTLGNDTSVSVAVPFNPLNVVGNVIVNVTATGATIASAG